MTDAIYYVQQTNYDIVNISPAGFYPNFEAASSALQDYLEHYLGPRLKGAAKDGRFNLLYAVNSFDRIVDAIDYYDAECSNSLYENGVELDNQILIWTSVNEPIKEWKGDQQ